MTFGYVNISKVILYIVQSLNVFMVLCHLMYLIEQEKNSGKFVLSGKNQLNVRNFIYLQYAR